MSFSHFVLTAFTALSTLGLGALILFKDPTGLVHRSFAAFSLSVAAWTMSNGLVAAYADTAWGYIWGRLAFASASAIPFCFLIFSIVFPTRPTTIPRLPLRVFGAAASMAFVASLSPFIVRSTTSVDGLLQVQYGPFHLPFGIYFISCLGYSLYRLTKKSFSSSSLEKLQIRYLLGGVLVAAVGATIANLIVPLLVGKSQYSRYGPLFGMFMVAVIAHAIIRYRLLDIKVVIRTGVVYVCAIAASASVFLLVAELLKRFGAYPRDSISMPEALVVALLLAIAFQPLKTLLHTYLNRYLYRETYDYERTLRDATHHLSTLLELEPLLRYLVTVVEATLRAEHSSVYLWNAAEKAFLRMTVSIPTGPSNAPAVPRAIPADSPLAQFFLARRQTLVREEAVQDANDPLRWEASRFLKTAGGEVAFPLLDGHTLLGAVVVGPKRSGDPFFSDDITLLETLVSQATIALANAQLYRQVLTANQYVDNILTTMDSGVVAVDSNANVTLFNSAAERLTRLRSRSLLNTSYQALPSCLALPLKDTLDLRVARTQFETIIQHSDGTFVPIVCSTALLRREGGAIDGALIVFSDLTRVKGLEREKRRAERLSSLGALASGVAHEIKNPLVAIRTFAELLPERYKDVDFREDFSKVVITEIARIDDLVARLRGLAAPASAPVGAVDVREPIDDTLLLLRAQLEQTRTVVRCDFQDSAPLVAVHHSQLKQLFLNLFLNALDAMGVEGVLSIAVTRRVVNGAETVRVDVSDTGPGIPEALRAAVFEPFFTTKPKGSGLGLAICRGIVDAHRGSIQAECKPDTRGTTIVVELPAGSPNHVLASEQALHSQSVDVIVPGYSPDADYLRLRTERT